jgi:hypothetical protein
MLGRPEDRARGEVVAGEEASEDGTEAGRGMDVGEADEEDV